VDFRLTEDQQQLRDMTRELAREEFAPLAAEWDQTPGSYPLAALAKLAELGFLSMAIPEEYGGVGYGAVANALVVPRRALSQTASGWPPCHCGRRPRASAAASRWPLPHRC